MNKNVIVLLLSITSLTLGCSKIQSATEPYQAIGQEEQDELTRLLDLLNMVGSRQYTHSPELWEHLTVENVLAAPDLYQEQIGLLFDKAFVELALQKEYAENGIRKSPVPMSSTQEKELIEIARLKESYSQLRMIFRGSPVFFPIINESTGQPKAPTRLQQFKPIDTSDALDDDNFCQFELSGSDSEISPPQQTTNLQLLRPTPKSQRRAPGSLPANPFKLSNKPKQPTAWSEPTRKHVSTHVFTKGLKKREQNKPPLTFARHSPSVPRTKSSLSEEISGKTVKEKNKKKKHKFSRLRKKKKKVWQPPANELGEGLRPKGNNGFRFKVNPKVRINLKRKKQ